MNRRYKDRSVQEQEQAQVREFPPTCTCCGAEVDIEKFIDIHGPEITYILGQRLIMVAERDVDQAMREFYEKQREYFGKNNG